MTTPEPARRMPAEWAPHERTLMAWPCRTELWEDALADARRDYATVANAIARFEPVTMVACVADAREARAALDDAVEIVPRDVDDSWLRDNGPVFVLDGDGRRAAIHFRFNAWGERYLPYDRDQDAGRWLASDLVGDPVTEAPLVLEGGSIAVDGTGTLVTTEQCLLHPNRNPDLSREDIEAALRGHLGVERIVWLGRGLLEDRDTDGHVDLIAAFHAPGKILLQNVDEANPNYPYCLDNRRRLESAGIEVTTLDWLPYDRVAGEQVAVPYLNLYVCNGAVIVPVTGSPDDDRALSVIAGAFPDREIVTVPGATLSYGGGGPHCITQQVPAVGIGS